LLQGAKVLDDPALLAKSLKRAQKDKAKSAAAWAGRTATQAEESKARLATRNENLQKKRTRGVNEMHLAKEGGGKDGARSGGGHKKDGGKPAGGGKHHGGGGGGKAPSAAGSGPGFGGKAPSMGKGAGFEGRR
jgi:hypothetical protein